MKLSEIQNILQATVLTGEDQLDKSVVGAGGADLMADVLSAVAKDALLLTGLTTEHVLRTARVRGKKPDRPVVEMAQSFQLPCMLTKYSLFVASGRLYVNGLRGLDGSW